MQGLVILLRIFLLFVMIIFDDKIVIQYIFHKNILFYLFLFQILFNLLLLVFYTFLVLYYY